jgi:glycosyltransferase involved in cell wall biosynthesis
MMSTTPIGGNRDSVSHAPPSVTVVVPAYNEEAGIEAVLRSLLDVRDATRWPIVVVDDGSTDQTPDILARFGSALRVIRHPVNAGYGAALKTGIRSARTENVICFDADGQHDPAQVKEFAERLLRADYVVGVRTDGRGIPWRRRPGKWLLRHVVSFLVGRPVKDINCGFRGGRRQLFLRMLSLLPDGFSFATTSLVYVLKSNVAVDEVPVVSRPRSGSSSVRIVRDGLKSLLLALRLIMLFDPLRAFVPPAIALVVIGLFYQVFIFFRFGLHVEGGAIVSILAGIVLFHFALVSDQIAALRKELGARLGMLDESNGAARSSDHA